MNQFGVLRHILNHPLNHARRLNAIRDYLAWQLGSRLLPGAVAVPFVNHALLFTRHGMHGATMNIYCGLADFSDMGFLLHLLRPDDLFADVGANVGSYTVLASSAIGARTVAFEPNPRTFQSLMANIHGNGIQDRVRALRSGVGSTPGTLRFEANDTQTRVVLGTADYAAVFESPIVTLNESLAEAAPVLIKIDVEGFENNVLDGADQVLRQPDLLALILENSNECVQYGFEPDQAHRKLLGYGFALVAYSPRDRKVTLLNERQTGSHNLIYVRDLEAAKMRLKTAPHFQVKEQQI